MSKVFIWLSMKGSREAMINSIAAVEGDKIREILALKRKTGHLRL
jgi:hypothetical protein